MAEVEGPPPGDAEGIMDEKRNGLDAVEIRSIPADDTDNTNGKAGWNVKSPKEDTIRDACRRRDIEELQSLAESPGGFVTDELRQEACT